ncbi:hypothetical protein MATL_G00165880 [Megalops atlanticus]|uniref:Uncharacterized protein n=1 Tax=Megalops atlanticus TaxID=7932 RepID=A0A9D3T2Q4_MEGAT|nr:hypothetical protein MATL_G00165880 [Megalops atlanticus]
MLQQGTAMWWRRKVEIWKRNDFSRFAERAPCGLTALIGTWGKEFGAHGHSWYCRLLALLYGGQICVEGTPTSRLKSCTVLPASCPSIAEPRCDPNRGLHG